MIFSSALVEQSETVKYWMGTEGLPLIEKWESTGILTYDGADQCYMQETRHILHPYGC